jgi:hypothetical protein
MSLLSTPAAGFPNLPTDTRIAAYQPDPRWPIQDEYLINGAVAWIFANPRLMTSRYSARRPEQDAPSLQSAPCSGFSRTTATQGRRGDRVDRSSHNVLSRW